MLTFPLKSKSVQSLLFNNLVFILDLTSSFLLIVSFLFRVLGMPEAELDVMSVSSHFSPASPASIMLWFPPLYIMVAWCMRRGEDRSCMSSWCPQWQMWPAPHFCMYVRPCICAYASASQKKRVETDQTSHHFSLTMPGRPSQILSILMWYLNPKP